MKKFWLTVMVVLMAAVMAFTFVGCGENPDNGGGGGAAANVDKDVADAALKNLAVGKKVYLTTIGQGELPVANNLMKAAGLTAADYTEKNDLKAAEVEEGAVVFMVLGASGKGLGAAGTDATKELARANEFKAAQEAGKLQIVAMHLGGKNRRGDTSDPSIRVIVPVSKVVMVVNADNNDGGNYDGLFTTLAGDSVPLYTFTKATKIVNSLKFLLGK